MFVRNTDTLTIGAGVGLLACILYLFWIFSKYAFAIVLIPYFLLSRWISIPRTNDASPRSFTLKLKDKNFFFSNDRLTSLLVSIMSSIHRIWKMNFPFFNFVWTLLFFSFSLKTQTFLSLFHQLKILLYRDLLLTHKCISTGDIPYVLFFHDKKPFGLCHVNVFI